MGVSFDDLLSALHEIQGAADPNHPDDSGKERLAKIYDTARRILKKSGWHPDEDD